MREGAEYLRRVQDDGGGFVSYTSREVGNFPNASGQVTTFATALILSATIDVAPRRSLERVHERAAAFLLRQQSALGTFNYWPRGSQQGLERPYPDDLDDTVCALAALQQYRPALVNAEMLAAVVKQLTLCEARVGGPYYTWIVPRDAPEVWRDVDLGVNSNVAYFLSKQGVFLPHLAELAETAIREDSYASHYYSASVYPVIYFISRFYKGILLHKLQRYVLERRDREGWWGNALDSALAVSALLNTGVAAGEVEPALQRLVASGDGGVWPARALYLERSGETGIYFAGAPALTTAFVLEALAKYANVQTVPERVAGAAPGEERAADGLYEAVVERVRWRFELLEGDLKQQAGETLERLLERDGDRQIGLLPYVWEMSLRPSSRPATREELVALGSANVYGWISYTIYDDFLDGEGKPPLLSVGNVALRELALLFARVMPGEMAGALVQGVMDRIDAANTWEVLHCRALVEDGMVSLEAIPDYGDFAWLAGRSLGHALGPLGLLLKRGCALDGSVMRLSLRFFTHYLIARQLNDDVHDWEEDLLRGQVNAVAALLLRRDGNGETVVRRQPIGPLVERLKKRLWQEEIATVCEHIFRHARAARRALEANPEVMDVKRLASMLDPLERAAREALEERTRTQAFIAAYEAGRVRRPQRGD